MTLTKLTHREREIAAWVSMGGDDKSIGRLLSIKPRTVQNCLHNIYIKLGITDKRAHISRVKLAVMVVRERGRHD